MKLYNFSCTWFGMVYSALESMMVHDKEVVHDSSKIPSQDIDLMWSQPVWLSCNKLLQEFDEFMQEPSPYRDVLMEYVAKRLATISYTYLDREDRQAMIAKRNPHLWQTLVYLNQRLQVWQLQPATIVDVELLKRGWHPHPDKKGWYINILSKKVGKGTEARDLYRVNKGILESTLIAMWDDHVGEGNSHGIAGITPDVRFDLYSMVSSKVTTAALQQQLRQAIEYTEAFEEQWRKDSSIVTQVKKRLALTR